MTTELKGWDVLKYLLKILQNFLDALRTQGNTVKFYEFFVKNSLCSAYNPFIKQKCKEKNSVLRIQVILMRIRILDPHWKKVDPDPNPDPAYFFKIYWNFLTKLNFQIFVFFFLLIFMLKLNEPFRNKNFAVHIFADPESQNLANPADPDPKH